MDYSIYDDITDRSLIRHASQEVPKYSTPLPVLQSVSKKRSAKRLRSALTIGRPSVDPNVTPRTLIKRANDEKIRRKSSPPALKDEQIFQLQQEKSRSRRSLHAPVDFDDISVDENEVTEERLPLPDIRDISAIAGCSKKQKLQLGKLDNRVYTKQMLRKSAQTVNQSPLEEEHEVTTENASSLQGNLGSASSRTRRNTSYIESDNSLSNTDIGSNINFNTQTVKGSPVSEKQKPFSEKRIPHLSSDSDATLPSFPNKFEMLQKSRKSIQPNSALNALSATLPLASSENFAFSSGRHSSYNRSTAKAFPLKEKNRLSHSLQLEGLSATQFSRQRARMSKGKTSSGTSDADEESLDEEEETVQEGGNIYLHKNIDEPAEISEKTVVSPHQKSMSRNRQPQHNTKLMPPESVLSNAAVVSLHYLHTDLAEEATEDQNINVCNDTINFVEISNTTSPLSRQKNMPRASVSQHSRKSVASRSKSYSINRANVSPQDTSLAFEDAVYLVQQESKDADRKAQSTSKKVGKLLKKKSSEITAPSTEASKVSGQKKLSQTTLPQGSAKTASASLPFNIVNSEHDVHNTSVIHHGSSFDLVEEDQDEIYSEDTIKEPETPKSTTTLKQKSRSRTSASDQSTTKSSSYNIINAPDIDMHGTPQVLEDASYRAPHQAKISGKTRANISRKSNHTVKTSEPGQLTSPTLSFRTSFPDSIKKKMHSTAIPDQNATVETLQENSLQDLNDFSSQFSHQIQISKRKSLLRNINHTAKMSELEPLTNQASSVRPRVSSSITKRNSAAISDHNNSTETAEGNSPHVLGDVLCQVSHQTTIHGRKTYNTSRKGSRTTKIPQLEQSVRSSVSGSIKKKMHSTAIPDHNASLKTDQGNSLYVSSIRYEKDGISVSDKTSQQLASIAHADSDGDEIESLASSSSESPPPVQKKKRRTTKTKVPRISAAETKRIIEHCAGMKISKGALNTVLESCDIFWENTFSAVLAYAKHANREFIDVQDCELLLYRQRYASDRNSMNALIAKYMPMEYREQIIPMATPGNIVIP